MFDFKLNPGY